jgi:hypothetical protein
MATVTAVILWTPRIKTPVARHAAWTAVLVSMLLLPVWTAWGPRAPMRVLPPIPAPREIMAAPPAALRTARPADRRPLETVEPVGAHTQGPDWQRVVLGVYIVVACDRLARASADTDTEPAAGSSHPTRGRLSP